MSASDPGRRPLSRNAIVAAAVELADAEGVESLTMRSLARHLGYEVMSLYNHVANKDQMLSLMVDAVAGEVPRTTIHGDPIAAVRAQTVHIRAALVRHPWAPPLWLRYLPGPARVQLMEDSLAVLAATGLPPTVAHLAFHAVNNHVLGYTLQEQAMIIVVPSDDGSTGDGMESTAAAFLESIDGAAYPHMVVHVQQHLDGDTAVSFEIVLDLILDGLVRLGESS